MDALLSGDERKNAIDHVYSVYFDENGMRLGNKRFDIDKDNSIIIDKVKYIGIPGLYELIFKRIPDDVIYTEDDVQKYKSILMKGLPNGYERLSNGYRAIMSGSDRKGNGLERGYEQFKNNCERDYEHLKDGREQGYEHIRNDYIRSGIQVRNGYE
ncbi:hypothetical protein EAG_02030 [Camponotus floridanus]|uniref:DUF8207 domain-containing protein n=1 Tax=Camponotus floridanus TaxID=104421 RepID=E2AYN3_CAMFO|nr:hypothetical protein EAG_02030 [Camponotus floridanus]